MDDDAEWLRALARWLATVAGSAVESARALTIATRLEGQEKTLMERWDRIKELESREG